MKSSPSSTSEEGAPPQTCWILTDGKLGTEKQCIALADALGLAIQTIRLTARTPWRFLPPVLWFGCRHSVHDPEGLWENAWSHPDGLPDVIISASRVAAAPAAALRRHARAHLQNPPLFIHLLNPHLSPRRYDAVIAPYHDHLEAPNVFPMQGALVNITPDFLSQVRSRGNPMLDALPTPRIALLVGGNSKYYTLTEDRVLEICKGLQALHTTTGCSFMATLSRRTPTPLAEVFQKALAALPHVLWDGVPPNPYNDYLAWADALLVTEDSISMVADAAATGKPVYILEMQGKAPKFQPYFRALYEKGIIRKFEGEITQWTYPPLLEVARLAELLKAQFKIGRKG